MRVPWFVLDSGDEYGVHAYSAVGERGVSRHHLAYRHIYNAETEREMGVDITGDSEHPHFVGQRAGSQLVDKTCRYQLLEWSAQPVKIDHLSDACMAGVARRPVAEHRLGVAEH